MAKESKVTEKTIRELCNRVASNSAHLLPNDEEAIVVYQDLIGHATEEENSNLANEPALMETFYRIYGVAYGTVAAIKFYMDHSNRVYNLRAELDDYKEELEEVRTRLKNSEERAKFWEDKSNEYKEELKKKQHDIDETCMTVEMLRKESMELKAKLYDLQSEIEVMRKG